MKNRIALLLLLAFCNISNSQKLSIDSLTNTYQTVIKLDFDSSIEKSVLYGKVKEWIALNYKSAKDVIQYEDNTNKDKIIVRGNFKTSLFMKEGWIEHTIIFDFKKGRTRVTFKDFSYYSQGSGRIAFEQSRVSKKKVISETEQQIEESILSIKKLISQNKSGHDDW